MNQGLIKSFIAGAAIATPLIVKFGADDNTVLPAAAVGDSMFGVSDNPGGQAVALGERVDVVLTGITEVTAGGAITRGDPLTSDANGKAVSAAPAAGVNNRIIGHAMVSAVLGDVFPFLLGPGRIQG